VLRHKSKEYLSEEIADENMTTTFSAALLSMLMITGVSKAYLFARDWIDAVSPQSVNTET
jgi:hypothetical protein